MGIINLFKHKRVQGILLWVISGVLGAKGIIDPATAAVVKDIGIGWGALGVVHAQEKAKAK